MWFICRRLLVQVFHTLKLDCHGEICNNRCGVRHFGPAVPLEQVHTRLLWRKVESGCSGANGKSTHCSTVARHGYLNPPVCLFLETHYPPILSPGSLNPRDMSV